MLIQGHDDDQLRLSDIARIEKDYEDPTRNEMFMTMNVLSVYSSLPPVVRTL